MSRMAELEARRLLCGRLLALATRLPDVADALEAARRVVGGSRRLRALDSLELVAVADHVSHRHRHALLTERTRRLRALLTRPSKVGMGRDSDAAR